MSGVFPFFMSSYLFTGRKECTFLHHIDDTGFYMKEIRIEKQGDKVVCLFDQDFLFAQIPYILYEIRTNEPEKDMWLSKYCLLVEARAA